MAFGWKVHGEGRGLAPGEVVKPDERLSWPRMVGFGAQHVIAMFGATFVFPLVMGLDPNVAVMMSGVATILFLLIVQGKVPSYLGTSASFVGAVVAIRAAQGDSATVTGAILVAGIVLALCGVAIHYLGVQVIHRIFPPVVTGAVVMLIGFGLAFVVADVYWPQDHWIALITMIVTFLIIALFKGFLGRIGILLGLVIGFVLSWAADKIFGDITAFNAGTGAVDTHPRVSFDAVAQADWFGLPNFHGPTFQVSAIVLVLPAVIALIAENVGHVKAVGEMTKTDVDPYIGRAVIGDGVGTVLTSAVGGSPTTTYAENIGVMAATRVYSTAAYYIAGVIAILFGLIPKFGALVAATPGGVLGGITVILYGMIGLLGAKIWVENRVNFADPVNMLPIGAGIILAIGPVSHTITDDFSLAGIALGTIVVLGGYHLLRALSGPAPAEVGDVKNSTG
ncbi:nitrate reductase [Acrocarpospora phusangensis]|uniref:Nitrate reductase n=1 Tax=Acrocarpospora phusangensis TaxID=1070424 RepID=A0A919QHL5_9ACTN|nr:solute carrier family 23 protein [Acrocarpospora phusangensis]GIH29219.1 nitrate reductase [Acrocarpospora phusangensis]